MADDCKQWMQRIHATLFHQGVPSLACYLLSPAGCQGVHVALAQIARLDVELASLRPELVAFGRRQLGCRALQVHYGIGALLSVAI